MESSTIRNSEGVASLSPRLLYSATLGHKIAAGRNPEGVVSNRRHEFPR
jgi:hypothetical protein